MHTPPAVTALAAELRALGWVSDLWVGGSLATDDHRPGVSDLDLVALTDRPLGQADRSTLAAIHRELDAATARGAALGCAYVETTTLPNPTARHPTWTHGVLVERPLSGIARVELVRHGFAVLGREPATLLPAATAHDVRRAAHAELVGYWTTAARRPWWWLDPDLADLALLTMARARHALATGELVTKTSAIDLVRAPEWLRTDLRARRNGNPVTSPRLRAGWLAWSDARRTTAAARRTHPPG